MIWAVCGLLTAALILCSVRLLLSKKAGVSRMVFVLGCLFVATFAVYIPPFVKTYGIWAGIVGDLAHVLQVVTVDADVTNYYPAVIHGLNNDLLIQAYILLLGTVHIFLPAVAAMTAVTVLFRCFASMQLFFVNHSKRPLFVFSEVNEQSLHLAKSLEKIKCDIVFANKKEDTLGGEIKHKYSLIFKEESISELHIRSKKSKDIYFFCISKDEDQSLGYTLKLIEKYAEEKESRQEHIHIYQFSKHQDFSIYVDSTDKGELDVHCVNEYEMLIYNLLDKYPLMDGAVNGIHVLLYGLSKINVIALKTIAWCGQISGYPLRISVVGVHMNKRINDLKLEVPGLFTERYDIRFWDCQNEMEVAETIRRECKDVNYSIVSENTDNASMERGVLLRRLFYSMDEKFAACPAIFCYIREPAKANLVERLATAEANPKRKMPYNLTPFGSVEEVYTYQSLVDADLEKVAKNVHLAYEEIFSDGEIDVKQALKAYKVFEVNKRSNRANALHIRYKLRMLGLDYTLDPAAEPVRLEAYYTDEAMDKMAFSEHSRWMAFLESEGWIPATREQVKAYIDSDISKGRHKCPILQMHPYICPYEDLKELSEELENKDTTVYDKELILRIPQILGDKWKVAGRAFKIVRAADSREKK